MVRIYQSAELDGHIDFDSHDSLLRKSFWEWLANLIQNSENESLVISINAPWWEWKTHFLKMWKNYLINDKSKKVIYFNSFKNDYLEDPFTALLWELVKEFDADKTTTDKILDKWINVLKGILPLWWKIWARFILGWDIKWIDDKIEELVEWDIVEWIKNTLSEYSKQEDTVKAFRDTLEEIIKDKWDVIFIIDELDRCRPDFALRLLERIKHFFEIKGLYFVLWINKKQLENYISSIYGNIDTKKYLQKFIDIEAILPKNIDKDNWDITKYIDYLSGQQKIVFIEKKDINWWDFAIRLFKTLAHLHNLSLRDVEKVFNYLNLIRKILPENHLILYPLTLILIFSKNFDLELYKKFREGSIEKDNLMKLLAINEIEDVYDKEYLMDEINYFFDKEIPHALSEKYKFLHQYWSLWSSSFHSRLKLLSYHFNLMESYNLW